MKNMAYILVAVFLIAAVSYGTYNYIITSQQTIVVGYLPSDHHAALFVANAKGMFEKEGLNVRLVPFRAGPDLIKAAKLGQIDIGYCGISPVTMAINNGTPLKIIAPVNEEGSGIVVGNNVDINSISDFKGKTIAIPQKNSVQDVLLNYLLVKNNIDKNEVNITESEVPFMPKSLFFKKFDAFVAWEPYVSSASMEGDGKVFLHSEDIWNNVPCCVVITTDNFAKNNPGSLRKFLNAHVEATDYINSHKNETALIVSKKLGTNITVEEEGLKHVQFIALPSKQFTADVFKFIAIQRQLGYIKSNSSNISYFDFSFLPEVN